MKIKLKELIYAIAIPLALGGLSGFLTRNSMSTFDTMEKPPLSPPGWLFPVVWTILYILMGVASYLVYTSFAPRRKKQNALIFYALQLLFNILWPFFFFTFELFTFSFVWLIIMWALIIITCLMFWKISKPSAYLLIPYIVWVTFAAYLNLGIAILN